MNPVTKAVQSVINELERNGNFKGVDLITAELLSTGTIGCCACFEFEMPDSDTSFDANLFENDFRTFLVDHGIPVECIPEDLYFAGGDVDFYDVNTDIVDRSNSLRAAIESYQEHRGIDPALKQVAGNIVMAIDTWTTLFREIKK